MTRRLPIAAIACLALAGCSSESNSNPEDPGGQSAASGQAPQLLSATDLGRVQQAAESVTADCESVSMRDVRTLVEVHAEDPNAIFEPGTAAVAQSMDELVAEKRDQLADCGRQRLAAALDRALGEGS